MSPQIFASYIEPSAQSIQFNSTIKSLRVKDEEHKLALYAILFLTPVENALPPRVRRDLYGYLYVLLNTKEDILKNVGNRAVLGHH